MPAATDFPPPPSLPQTQRVTGEGLTALRQEVNDLLERNGQRGFPGSQPVSFGRMHLQELQERDYYVCEKSDGIRVLMYLTTDYMPDGPVETAYLIDRKNDYYWVRGIHFPRSADSPMEYFTKTLLDGELVNDMEPDGSVVMRYLVFDCLVCDGKILVKRELDKRIAHFHELVYRPYKELLKRYPQELEHQPFHVEMKKMEFSYGTEMMFKQTLQHLKHGNDGLIFTCRVTPYSYGTDQKTLKWKPLHENSIDFKLQLGIPMYEPSDDEDEDDEDEAFPDYEVMPTFNLSVMGNNNEAIPYSTMTVTEAEWEKLKALEEPLDERIVECVLDEQKKWRFMRFRDDKKGANHISTVESVIDSIRDPVTEEQLIQLAPVVKRQWKARNAQPK